MPPIVDYPTVSHTIVPELLTNSGFAPFGTVATTTSPHSNPEASKTRGVKANQGTALKFPDVMQMTNSYHLAPSRTPARTAISLFSCQPRPLRRAGEAKAEVKRAPTSTDLRVPLNARTERLLFDLQVLERHPYTSQTFVPMIVSPADESTCYLVIVAAELSEYEQQWVGYPDLRSIRAFVVRGNQAVTYAAGTWHAPMVVLGSRHVDFVVTQWANGVPDEDCQEVFLEVQDSVDAGPVVAFDLPLDKSRGIVQLHGNTPKL